jgi:hypothetical protein
MGETIIDVLGFGGLNGKILSLETTQSALEVIFFELATKPPPAQSLGYFSRNAASGKGVKN